MKLYPDKLEAHLSKTLAPVYLLHGDEPLQLMEIGDRLRVRAKESGFDERQVIAIADDSDWSTFREAADSFSLFAEQRLIELRLPTGKPGRIGGEVLQKYCSNPPADILLLITSSKLDRNGTNSAWFKAIDKVGVSLAVWPVPAAQLGAWLTQRLAAKGLYADADALELIADRVEGNLLAARQEVERLALLYPAGELSSDQILAAVSDSSRYSIGDLSLAALHGESVRALRILAGLHDEAVSEVLVLWSLVNEIRAGARAAESIEAGASEDAALKSAGVWQSRTAPLKKALTRHTASSWLSMLSACTHIDRQIKGQASGSHWDSLAALTTELAGHGEIPLRKNSGIPV
ncbi:DNA polymerase III subunit delta [Granulosicoccus antarcticus]|uniref:DNA polymerase III subunit delta n=1 Tax=Granulosicoccus antarcticus IMCC3135 TaxID=1192854 RepID=A0A2Z2NIA1_9GAMM|nr:DNA polymerase III subunit delta [Granulosicoccus antarcticus]ASJ71062.1 DNA polymerase III subunit delta [Granulosicoccus antarcticus IMCC3135]